MRTTTSSQAASRYMEHRWGERIALDCPARLVLYDGAMSEGRLRNASISGAFIITVVRLTPLTPLNVMLALGLGMHRRCVELPACVVRCPREGLAVEWRDMAIPTVQTLLREAGASGFRVRG